MGNKKKPYLKRKWARTLKETMKIAREAKSQKKLCSETTKKSMESPEFIDLMPVQLVNGMDTVQNAATEVNSVYVNKKSDWYIQAQGQMHIANRSKCLFAAWYGDHKLKIEILEKDDDFWKKEMEPKLTNFYLECLLPELVDPRYPRKKPIRDPEYVITKNNKVSCQTT